MHFSRLLAVAAAAVAVSSGSVLHAAETEQLQIRSADSAHEFTVEIADDPSERATGLMNRREMSDTAGMLFDFGEDRSVQMWMKNTYIPLDMLFIDKDGVVRSVAKRTTPLSERIIPSGGAIRYVLEINGGVSDKLGIKAGDQVVAPAIRSH